MTTPARQPGARPPSGGRIDSTSSLLRTISHEISEFEFHISPAPSSSRPQTGVGTCGTSSSSRPRAVRILAEAVRALDRLGDVGNVAVAPAAHLVPEESEAACRACPDRTLGDDAALGAVAGSDRCLLDYETSLRHAHLKCGVVEVAAVSPLEPRHNCLEDAPVQPDRVATRPERKPVQIDLGDRKKRSHRLSALA
jgi:hypothetical protein